MTQIDVAQVINTVLVLFGIVGGTGSAFWIKGKKDLHALRDIFDKVDDAATNGNVTEDQFQSIMTDARVFIHGNPIAPNPVVPQTQAPKTVSVTDASKITTT